MVSLRAIFLWFLLLAVPFQGFAAAAMAVCAPGSTMSMAIVSVSAGGQHDHGDGNAAADHHSDADVDVHAGAHGASTDGDQADAHKCGNCAPCHAVGLASAIPEIKSFGLPKADLAEPCYAPAIVSPGVPQKPPRA